MRRSFREVVFVLTALGIVFGVLIGCGSPKTDTSESAEPAAAAAVAEDTATDQDTSTVDSAAQEPAATKDTTTAQNPSADTEPAGKVESLLSGETLARYRALPEEYRVALDAYSAFGVSDDLIPTVVAEKMAQWPDSPEPIQDLLDADRYAIFGELTATHPKLEDEPKIQILSKFFLAYYPYVVLNEDRVEGRKQAFANLLDATANKYSPGGIPEVPEPRLDDVIVPSAVSVLDELGPRLREALTNRRSDEMVDVQSLAIELKLIEFMLLKSEPGLEVPPLTQYLTADERDLYGKIPADIREITEWGYAQGVLGQMLFQGTSPEYPTTFLPDEDYFMERVRERFEFALKSFEQREKKGS